MREVSSVCDTHTFIATTGGGGKGRRRGGATQQLKLCSFFKSKRSLPLCPCHNKSPQEVLRLCNLLIVIAVFSSTGVKYMYLKTLIIGLFHYVKINLCYLIFCNIDLLFQYWILILNIN